MAPPPFAITAPAPLAAGPASVELPVPWHPLRMLMTGVFRKLEPYAMDLWQNEIAAFMPASMPPASLEKKTYYGGLYQKLVLIR